MRMADHEAEPTLRPGGALGISQFGTQRRLADCEWLPRSGARAHHLVRAIAGW